MAQVNAGRVRFVGRGEYNNSTQYYTFDYVDYNGNSYFAKSNTLGNLPTNTNYWQLVAEKGNVGPTGPTGNGIASITKTSTSGLVDTYTITYTSGNTTTFNVTNGNGIDHISLTSQSGATKVYTIYFTDGNTTTFTVQDGEVTQEVFDEEIERANMIYNAMPKVSGEGTDLTLNNTAECPVYDIELSPSELEQATTSGKNLLSPNRLANSSGIESHEPIENGYSITLSSSAGSAVWVLLDIGELEKYKGKTLTFSMSEMGELYRNCIFVVCDDDGSNRTSVGSGLGSTSNVLTTTIGSEYTQTRLGMRLYITAGTPGETYTFNNIQVEEGDTATSYEPFTYGASPNPEFPQQIHTVSGDNTVVVGNKNLFDGIFESGIINGATGLDVPNSNYIRNKNYIPVEELTNYKMSTDSTVFDYFLVYEYKEDYTYNLTSNKFVYFNGYLTTKSGTKYIRFRPGSATTDTNIKVMVKKGTTATSYVPHQEQSLPLSLGDLEYCKIGDYEDEFRRSTGKNLFDKNTVTTTGYLEETGDIHTSGTDWQISDYIDIQPNTTYTTSGMNTAGTSPSRCYYDENKNFISGIKHNNTNPFINTSPSNAYFMRESIHNTNLDTTQVEEGNTATEWEPYGSGKWYLKKNVPKVTFDGSENWTIYGTGTESWQYRLIATTNVASGSSGKSNYYPYASIGGTGTAQGIGVTGGSFRIRYGTEDTVENFKTWLSTHNVELYYQTAVPTYTLLSDTLQTQLDNIHKAISYQEQTNVSQTNNDLPLVIKLSAIRDLSGIFELIQG